jgi:hypothetical protein
LALAFVWKFFLLSCHCFHAQLDLTRDTHFLLFVIVNAAAYFALDAHHCNNTTGSRRKELHRAGHRKSLRSPIPPFPLSMSVSSHGFYAHGVQASWAGLTAIIGVWFLVLFSFIWFTITTDGLRFGSSFTGYLIGTTSQSKISIPPLRYIIITILLSSSLINIIIGYCLLQPSRSKRAFLTVMLGSALPLHVCTWL